MIRLPLSSAVAFIFVEETSSRGLLYSLEKVFGVKSSKSKDMFWVDELWRNPSVQTESSGSKKIC